MKKHDYREYSGKTGTAVENILCEVEPRVEVAERIVLETVERHFCRLTGPTRYPTERFGGGDARAIEANKKDANVLHSLEKQNPVYSTLQSHHLPRVQG